MYIKDIANKRWTMDMEGQRIGDHGNKSKEGSTCCAGGGNGSIPPLLHMSGKSAIKATSLPFIWVFLLGRWWICLMTYQGGWGWSQFKRQQNKFGLLS
jgi:hypothetical protein